ncbi:MAG: HAMP domain-containing histidine kinase [Arcobacteraceae bacterium]|nr:HAMP domain-containing histidine kinase [Arcobacteraceae bacterium]
MQQIEKSRLLFTTSRASCMKDLINKISHHWRQKLSVISLLASNITLQKELGILEEREVLSAVKDIVKATQKLSDTLCVLGTGFNTKTDKADFVLSDLMDKILGSIEHKLDNKKITVSVNIDKKIKLNSYKNYLTDIILSILNNSINAFDTTSDEKRIILIDEYLEGDNLIINIKDNAGGIDEKIIDKIFDPYFTTKHDGQTEGLGLFVSKEIMLNNLIGDIEINNYELNIDNHIYKGVECMIIIKQ